MATQTEYFLAEHPSGMGGIDIELWRVCIERLAACAQACTACADACMAEPDAAELTRCIRLNMDCADICTAAERVVTRHTETDQEVLRSVLEACVRACRSCGTECARHADMHDHCRLCADTCRLCEEACAELLRSLR